MPFLNLPAEIREKILAYCVVQESLKWWRISGYVSEYDYRFGIEYPVCNRRGGMDYPVYDNPKPVEEPPPPPPGLKKPGNEDTATPDTEEVVSELWQAMGEIDSDALAYSMQMEKWQQKFRRFSVLYTCRKLYQEAIPIFYRSNLFNFACPGDLKVFSKRAREMGNHGNVRRIRIKLRCELAVHYKHRAVEWELFFEKEEDGVLWHFPGLSSLVLDFEKKQYIIGCHPGRHCVDVGLFREILKRTIKLPKVEVWGIADKSVVDGMERELSGLGEED